MSYLERIKRILYDELATRPPHGGMVWKRATWNVMSAELSVMTNDITQELYPQEGGDDEDEDEEEEEDEPGQMPRMWRDVLPIPKERQDPLVPKVRRGVVLLRQGQVDPSETGHLNRMARIETQHQSTT